MGDGIWDAAAYWAAEHGGELVPPQLANASRYQVYLWELGETFAVSGKRTVYPVPALLPAGFSVIAAPAANIPANGVPTSVPVVDPKRRLLKAVILDCQAQGVAGAGTYRTFGRYVEVFVTEPVPAPPDATAYAEIVSAVTDESDPISLDTELA